MKVEAKVITACRVCGSERLEDVLSLGNQFVSTFLDSPEQAEIKIPLDLVFCKNCSLLQLRHTTPAELLYRKFWYRSGISPTMRAALADITRKAVQLTELRPGDMVVDIGANDGTMLRTYQESLGLTLVGFEPAQNLTENQDGRSIIINDFFSHSAFAAKFGERRAKIITAIAMFYDLDDPNRFVADVEKCLHENGVFIIQMNYLPSMLEQNAFDNICHEHLEYYSLQSLKYVLDLQGFEIFDVELNDVNGGSFRVYAKHRDGHVKPFAGAAERLRGRIEDEQRRGLEVKKTYVEFADRINQIRNQVRAFLEQEISTGKVIYIRGASTRGNTTLQYFGIDHDFIGKAADRNKEKWGKFIPGTRIPIVPVEQAYGEKPDYFLILPWHFLNELLNEAKGYLESGGRFIVPLPHFRVLGKN